MHHFPIATAENNVDRVGQAECMDLLCRLEYKRFTRFERSRSPEAPGSFSPRARPPNAHSQHDIG
jgi:hypothetical protein